MGRMSTEVGTEEMREAEREMEAEARRMFQEAMRAERRFRAAVVERGPQYLIEAP